MNNLIALLDALAKRIDRLEHSGDFSHYRGTSAIDFTTTTLPHKGDYGYQTADAEVQMNCNGVIRAISTAAL